MTQILVSAIFSHALRVGFTRESERRLPGGWPGGILPPHGPGGKMPPRQPAGCRAPLRAFRDTFHTLTLTPPPSAPDFPGVLRRLAVRRATGVRRFAGLRRSVARFAADPARHRA